MVLPTDEFGVEHEDGPQDPLFRNFPEFMTANLANSTCVVSDEMRHGRTKTAHGQGVHAKVKWVPAAENIYSGLYADGSEHVLMRLSETTNLNDTSGGLLPSVALKFLIAGGESENLVAMPSFEPSSSWNFFEAPMRTRVEPITKESNECLYDTVVAALATATETPFACGVGHIGAVKEDGTKIAKEDIKVPWELSFAAPAALQSAIPSTKVIKDGN